MSTFVHFARVWKKKTPHHFLIENQTFYWVWPWSVIGDITNGSWVVLMCVWRGCSSTKDTGFQFTSALIQSVWPKFPSQQVVQGLTCMLIIGPACIYTSVYLAFASAGGWREVCWRLHQAEFRSLRPTVHRCHVFAADCQLEAGVKEWPGDLWLRLLNMTLKRY